MHILGGRRFALVGVPPVGCLPIVRTFSGADKCVDALNDLADSFNSQLIAQLGVLKKSLGVKTAYLDVFTVMSEAAKYPEKFGTHLMIILVSNLHRLISCIILQHSNLVQILSMLHMIGGLAHTKQERIVLYIYTSIDG